jgi:hypothetical protein
MDFFGISPAPVYGSGTSTRGSSARTEVSNCAGSTFLRWAHSTRLAGRYVASARSMQHVGRRNARGRARHGMRHSDRGFGGVSLAPLPATHRNSNSSAVRRPVTDDASHHRRKPPFRCDRRVLIRHGRACVPAPARPAMCRRCQTGRQSIQPARLQSREARCPNNSVQYYRFRRRSGGSNVR